ncbi:MAG: pectinacetylesterase family protein, partial [Treponema sp.]|nr:pectinacetylesterase family protein [Treponema sp.]
YNPNIGPIHEIGLDGILAKNDRNNPFNDWNFAALPYASGDLHMGDKDFPYTATDGSKCICHHHGLRNLDALLKLAVETFPHTKTLLITGSSAGAFGAVANAPRIARAFPQIQRTVIFADGAQGRYPGWKQVLRDVWNADPLYVDALDDEGRLIKVLFEQAWKALGDQAVYLHSNTTHDGVLCGLENAMNRGRMDTSPEALDFFNAALREDTAALAAELPRYRYYVTNYRRNPKTGVTGHTFIGGRLFTRAAMEEGRTLARWLDDAVNRDILVNAGERHIV